MYFTQKTTVIIIFISLVCTSLTTQPKDHYKRGPNVPYFVPDDSTTFKSIPVEHGGVLVDYKYADGSALVGFDGEDVVEMGGYTCLSRIAAISSTNSGDFDDVSGILGFGFTEAPRNPSLLYTMSTHRREDWNLTQPKSMNLLPRRSFAVVSNRTHGELQLTGYDPAAISKPMHFTPMYLALGYGAIVTSVKYGNQELFQFAEGHSNFTAVLDTGTTCLVLPSTDVNGTFTNSPYDDFNKAAWARNESLYIELADGFVLEFTIDDLSESCVDPIDVGMLLGNLLFRKYLTLFDVDNGRLGLAERNPSYPIGKITGVTSPGQTWDKVVVTNPETQKKQLVTKLGLVNHNAAQFHLLLSLGSPPQPLRVIFDTGSYMLAVFSDPPSPNAPTLLSKTKGRHTPPPAHATHGHSWKSDLLWILLAGVGLLSIVGIVVLRGTIGKHRQKVKEALLSSAKAENKNRKSEEQPEWMTGYGTL